MKLNALIVVAGFISTQGVIRWVITGALSIILVGVVPHLEQMSKDDSIALTHREIANVLNDLALSMSAGTTLVAALRIVAAKSDSRSHTQIKYVISLYDLGQDLSTALEWLVVQDKQWLPIVRMFQRTSVTGAPLLEQLDTYITFIGAQAQTEAMRKIRKVGVKSLLPLTICFLPAFMLLTVVPIVMSLVSTLIR